MLYKMLWKKKIFFDYFDGGIYEVQRSLAKRKVTQTDREFLSPQVSGLSRKEIINRKMGREQV